MKKFGMILILSFMLIGTSCSKTKDQKTVTQINDTKTEDTQIGSNQTNDSEANNTTAKNTKQNVTPAEDDKQKDSQANTADTKVKVKNDEININCNGRDDLIASYTTPNDQTVYLVGTIHFSHFDKQNGYALTDLRNCIENIKPDHVFIESREEIYNEYNVVDGPIDMIYTYSYCKENNIPVDMIDYWKFDNNFASNTTSDDRDDHMFSNIEEKLKDVKAGEKVLIFFGSAHFYFQQPRMVNAGWKEETITNHSFFFNGQEQETRDPFPASMADVIQDKIEYLKADAPKIIEKNITDEETKKAADQSCSDLADNLEETKKLVLNNKLYN